MGDALDALATGLFAATVAYGITRWLGDRAGARRAAVLAFCTATPVNYLGRRLFGGDAEPPQASMERSV